MADATLFEVLGLNVGGGSLFLQACHPRLGRGSPFYLSVILDAKHPGSILFYNCI